ncbi:MAG TPA: protoglobin domain-containing protein [Polyangiaceae bacterium]|nr:protoglobin domain-containing protein [Polyangiaceae bacterium]
MTDPGHPPVTLEEWERRKSFVGFGKEDEDILAELHLVAKTYAGEVMAELYDRWLSADEVRAFFKDDATLVRVKGLQKRYFVSLTGGDYGANYLADRLRIGRVHQRIGLEPRWYMGAYAIYMQIVAPRVLAAFEYNRVKQARAIAALLKIIALDQELAMLTYFAELPAGDDRA